MRKSTILALAVALTTASGAAMAQTDSSPAKPVAPSPTQAQPAVPAQAQPAVPMQVQPVPNERPSLAANPFADPRPSDGMPASGIIMTDEEAYSRLEQQGYRDIQGLTKGTDGQWHARALRGAAAVSVSVGPHGHIAAQ